MKIAPFNGYKGKLYRMLNGINENFVKQELNAVIAKERGISFEAAKKTRTISYKESSVILEKFFGTACLSE